MPRVNTATKLIHKMVKTAIHISKGLPDTLLMAPGAKFRPIIITIAPVTIGGMSFSIQPVPVFITIKPIAA